MVPLLAAIASRQFDVFTAAQAQQAGYSDDEIRARVRAGEWTPLRRGVYTETTVATAVRGDPDAFHRVRAAAGVLALSKGALASHQSAAALHDLPLVGPIGSAAHTTRPEGPPPPL